MTVADYKCLGCSTEHEHEQDKIPYKGNTVYEYCGECGTYMTMQRVWRPVSIGFVKGAGNSPVRAGKRR